MAGIMEEWNQDEPSSPTLNAKLLYGSLPEWPCRGGAPGMKKLEKLLPTYIQSTPSSASQPDPAHSSTPIPVAREPENRRKEERKKGR